MTIVIITKERDRRVSTAQSAFWSGLTRGWVCSPQGRPWSGPGAEPLTGLLPGDSASQRGPRLDSGWARSLQDSSRWQPWVRDIREEGVSRHHYAGTQEPHQGVPCTSSYLLAPRASEVVVLSSPSRGPNVTLMFQVLLEKSVSPISGLVMTW